MPLVETQSLTKHYGRLTALDNCSLSVNEGEVFGLLGPNGAGKTTLIRLLLGFLRPTRGSARIDGLDCFRQSVKVRERLSYLPAEARLFRRMRGRDVLKFLSTVRGPSGNFEHAVRLAGRLDLDIDRRVALMSTGMRQKLALAATLSHDTRLLILDEPTANLDPNVRQEVISIVAQLRDEGQTILLSSHVLSEMEEACDRVVIVRNGRLVHTQIVEELRRKHRVVGRWLGDMPEPPVNFLDRVTMRRNAETLSIETEGELRELLPWIASLPLEQMTIEPFGLRSLYDRFHSSQETT